MENGERVLSASCLRYERQLEIYKNCFCSRTYLSRNSEEIDVVEMLGQDASRCSKQQEGKCLVQFNLGICMHAISLLHKSAHVFVPDEPMCAVDDRVHAE